jgi:hypothetical protein
MSCSCLVMFGKFMFALWLCMVYTMFTFRGCVKQVCLFTLQWIINFPQFHSRFYNFAVLAQFYFCYCQCRICIFCLYFWFFYLWASVMPAVFFMVLVVLLHVQLLVENCMHGNTFMLLCEVMYVALLLTCQGIFWLLNHRVCIHIP